MATFAWFWNNTDAANATARTIPKTHSISTNYTLRAMPNEDIHVFIKKIDNTRVVLEQDPKASASCWKAISTACVAALCVVGLIVPIANSYLAGYAVTELQEQNNTMRREFAHLASRESELTSPEALARAAEKLKYLDPAPENFVVLNNERSGTVAMHVTPSNKQ